MAARQKEGSPVSPPYRIEFPHDPRQTAVRSIVVHAVGVRIAGKVEQAASSVWRELPITLGPNRQKRALQPKPVTVFTGVATADEFIHEADDSWMICQRFQRTTN